MEILSIGSELLTGFTINTNASYLCNYLHEENYPVDRVTVVHDSTAAILSALVEAFARTDIVIATGGLGPTVDDVTRTAAAEYFQCKLVYNEEIAQMLKAAYGDRLVSCEDQATVPEKAHLFSNAIGTAQGLLFNEKGKMLFLLPGVPAEMRQLFQDHVLPFLLRKHPVEGVRYKEKICIYHTIESAVDPIVRKLHQRYPTLIFGIYPYRGRVSITIKGVDQQQVSTAKQELTEAFSDQIFQSPDGTLESAIHVLLSQKGLTFAAAESCTGGSIAARITAQAGASDYFLGSCVTYSNSMKTALLGVSEKTLEHHGAVSEETAREMLQGILQVSKADCAVATTGIAGPSGGSADKPVGTVWCAVGMQGKDPHVLLLKGRGNREMVVDYSVTRALGELYFYLKAQSY